MNKKLSLEMIDYLSLILVLSYILLHNIYVVLIGLILAVSSINRIFIEKLKSSIYNKIQSVSKIKKDYTKNKETSEFKSDDTNTISLVEIIEESGFIPSIDKDDNSNAA